MLLGFWGDSLITCTGKNLTYSPNCPGCNWPGVSNNRVQDVDHPERQSIGTTEYPLAW